MLKAIIKSIVDGQAWLYANQLKLQAKLDNPTIVITADQFEAWEDEWKSTTWHLAQQLDDTEQEDSNETAS